MVRAQSIQQPICAQSGDSRALAFVSDSIYLTKAIRYINTTESDNSLQYAGSERRDDSHSVLVFR